MGILRSPLASTWADLGAEVRGLVEAGLDPDEVVGLLVRKAKAMNRDPGSSAHATDDFVAVVVDRVRPWDALFEESIPAKTRTLLRSRGRIT